MFTLLGAEPAALVLTAPLHHFAEAGMSIWSFAGIWHLITTVIAPAILIALSFVLMLFSSSSARTRDGADDSDRPAVVAFSSGERSGAGEERARAGRRSGETSAVHPVTTFYRVTFADERGFRLWSERVVELAAVVRDLLPDRLEVRPVIFLPLRIVPGASLHGYVSAGARALTAHLGAGAVVDPNPVSAENLPRGLTMLFGDGVDAAAYEGRHA